MPVFQKGFSRPSLSKNYKSYIETGVRTFVRACLSDDNRMGLPKNIFPNYRDMIEFINGHPVTSPVKISKSSISNLKSRKPLNIMSVPRTEENEVFVAYIKEHFETFDATKFFS